MMDNTYLRKRRDTTSFVIVLVHLLVVVSPVYAAAALGPGWPMLALWLFFGLSMNSVLNLMHECAHLQVFTRRSWTERLGKRLLGPFVFADFNAYRHRHWDHHRFVGREGETKDTYLTDVRGAGLVRLFCRCLLLAEASHRLFKQSGGRRTGVRSKRWLGALVGFQASFAVSILLTARAFNADRAWTIAVWNALAAYGGVYVYGLASLTVFMAALRAIAEHQQYGDDATTVGYAALRNFRCGPLSRFLMGAYGFGEHYTHHMHPAVPYYNLRSATLDVARHDPSFQPGKGYFAVLADIISR